MKDALSSLARLACVCACFGLFVFAPRPVAQAEPAPAPAPAVQAGLPNFSDLVRDLTPVTVNISTTKTVRPQFRQFNGPFGQGQPDPFRDFFGDDFFRRFFGDIPEREFKQQSLGSGFIIDNQGHILTNNHVIEGADEITVKTHDEREYDAEVIGRDPKTDLALIKIIDVETDLPVAAFGDSDALKVGEWVIAIGNPFGLQETVTAGIVSAKWRKIGQGPYEDFIQTDASINPGNSGGPLFDLQGRVVGVNTMIFSPSGGNVGIGFAIPINLAKNVVAQLKDKGRVVRGWLGVVVQTVTPELAEQFQMGDNNGALIADVDPDGPAAEAGLRPGDIIIAFDGTPVKDMADLPLMVAETPVGKKATVTVLRNGKKRTERVTIGELQEKEPEKTARRDGKDLGLAVREITPEMARAHGLSDDTGVVVTGVAPGSPAGSAGVRSGDIIREVNRTRIHSLEDYRTAIKAAGESNILLLLKRGSTSLWIVVKQED